MALATKCPHCHTVFRVALDQLKLRGGIVRCGACNEIFDGNAALVEPPLPPAVIAPPLPAAPVPPALDLELDLDEPAPALAMEVRDAGPALVALEPEPAEPTLLDAADEETETETEAASMPAARHDDADERREPDFDMPSEHIVAVALDDLHHFGEAPQADVPPVAPDDAPDDTGLAEAGHAADRGADAASAADLLMGAPESALLAAGAPVAEPRAGLPADESAEESVDESADEPAFVTRARRREHGARLARLAMIAGVPLLALVLLGQGVYGLRNRLAADYPALKPALQALCAPLGCAVELPRQIDALAIEQGELQTLAPDTYSFVTVLRNQSRSVQAWPHIELVLNDTADKPVLRRVFAPRDYLAAPADAARGFGPRSEQAVKLYFELDRIKASGYHIAIFYP